MDLKLSLVFCGLKKAQTLQNQRENWLYKVFIKILRFLPTIYYVLAVILHKAIRWFETQVIHEKAA
jgi:predicted component of viral defense system (DUF524 family)